ncbi:inosine/xanthosine triphosphatase [Marinomonas sp. 2405UD68-3]|uniref:inosine/xanthosine triphosphatase n=1 Tax=Marinomonas sp. 2405UD68-3 TaxID=3391835 RepID=UPI0039C9AE12
MSLLKVIVGSTNPVKISAVQTAMARLHPQLEIDCRGIKAPSGVPIQPITSKDTREGALNRAKYCKNQFNSEDEIDYFIAFEGGVDIFEDGPATFAYVAVLSSNQQSIGCSARLPLPLAIYNDLIEGTELGDVIDRRFHTHNIKQQGGAIGLLTNHGATRVSTYTEALILTMAPFLHPEQY